MPNYAAYYTCYTIQQADVWRGLAAVAIQSGWRVDFEAAGAEILYLFGIVPVSITANVAGISTITNHINNAVGLAGIYMGYSNVTYDVAGNRLEQGNVEAALTAQEIAPLEAWVQVKIPNFDTDVAGILPNVDTRTTALPKAINYILYLIANDPETQGLIEPTPENISVLAAYGITLSIEG